jgi:hypothetical protein
MTAEQTKNGSDKQRTPEPPHPWEGDVAVYPLREPGADPAWAVWTVKIWLGLALASGLFILALLVLGFIYD